MPYFNTDGRVGLQAVADTSTTQRHPLGTLQRALDYTYGEGEFIYLSGVASTAVGDVVTYDVRTGATTRALTGSRGPVAVAMATTLAGQFGWYQVSGSAVVRTVATLGTNTHIYVTGTAGIADDGGSVPERIDNTEVRTNDGTPAAGFSVVSLMRPALNGGN